MTSQPSRPIGVTILAALAFIAGLVDVYHALQYLGILPRFLGPIAFFGIDILGAILYIVLAAIWIWVGRMLWQLNPQGWTFMVALAGINIIFAVLAVIGASSFGAQLPAILINAAVLIYAYSSGVKKAFGVP
jgi:hypothetical protein